MMWVSGSVLPVQVSTNKAFQNGSIDTLLRQLAIFLHVDFTPNLGISCRDIIVITSVRLLQDYLFLARRNIGEVDIISIVNQELVTTLRFSGTYQARGLSMSAPENQPAATSN